MILYSVATVMLVLAVIAAIAILIVALQSGWSVLKWCRSSLERKLKKVN